MTRFFSILLLVNLSCIAQDFTRQWIYLETIDEQKLNADIVDVWEYYIQNPINLNDSTELYRIRELNLLSEKELNLITSHCQSQQLISIYQLQTLDIQIEALKRIKDFIYIPIKNKPITATNKASGYFGLQFQTPQRNGTLNREYIGSPIKSHLRYRTTLKKGWSLGLNWEKDLGEPLWYTDEGANNITLNLIYKGEGNMRKVLLGKYDISIGEGLLFGTSYRINNPYFLNYKPTSITKSTLSSKEYNYFEGAAAQWRIRNTNLNIFASHQNLNGKSSIDKSGLFRTKTELENRKTFEENLIGIQLERHHKQNTFSWAGIVYNSEFYETKNRFLQSFYASNNYYNITYSGEFVLQDLDDWATLQKLDISVSDNSLFSVQFRSRSDSLFNEYRSDYSSFSNGYESAVYYAFQHNFNKKWLFRLTFDHFKSNLIKTTEPHFPKGNKILSDLMWISEQRKFTLQYQYKNIENLNYINKFRLFYQEELSDRIRWNTKLNLIIEKANIYSSLQSNYYWKSLNEKNKVNFSFCLFNTESESIYWRAPYFYGSYNSRFLTGKGNTTSLSFQKKIDRSLKAGMQITQINYYDREVIGTGNEMIDSNSKIEFSVYLKWKN
jgi:hypothetical protein